MGDTLEELEAIYCPPLDAALLSAILSDYDLESKDQLRAAREALDQLKESAELEDQAGFDASGTGGRENDVQHFSRPESCPGETNTTASRETDLTSLSASWQSLDLDSKSGEITPGNSDIADEIEDLDEDTKIQLLEQIMGKQISLYTVKHTLRKCNGNWHKAMDELLSQIYMHEAENSDGEGKLAVKGIDAFAEEHSAGRGRKAKGKKKKGMRPNDSGRSSSLPTTPDNSSPTAANAWQGGGRDIEFIASRTGEPAATVATIYYKSGASRPKTISSILKSHLSEGTAALSEDPEKAVAAYDLGQEYPSIDSQYIASLISLTYPDKVVARELAEALTTRAAPEGGIQIIPAYVRPNLEDGDAAFVQVTSRKPASSGHVYSSDIPDARERASNFAAARSAALAQAHAAHRKAKSDRLMGGAAAYYGEESRRLYALSSGASAAAADQLVASQSNSTQLDLHGVDVLNAVRISRQRVEQWWNGLGENRTNGRIGATQRQSGYRIVVGLGTHSVGGRSKLGPAVRKMLNEEGWRNELTGAVITVHGRAKR